MSYIMLIILTLLEDEEKMVEEVAYLAKFLNR